MKLFIQGLALVAVTALCGCGKDGKDGKAGGSIPTDPDAKAPLYGQDDGTFNLTTNSASIKPGETVEETIGIKRGKNFSQNVAITFADLPAGITITPNSPVLKSDSTNIKFSIVASADAMPGDFTIKVIGHPATGADATNDFKLTVGKKDTFTISMPFWTTALKQGEAKAVSITINREKQFDQDVTLQFDKLPKGVTLEPKTAVIKNGENEAKFTIKAADDAALGDFGIQAIGHPTKGADATHEFKFKVSAK